MELTPIGKEKLEITLTKKDMERFRLTAERLDYKNTETRRAVWTILDKAKRQTGFDAAKGQIRIDALPGKEGGCIIFITKTEKEMNGTREKYSSEKSRTAVYSFSCLAHLLAAAQFLKERGYRGESSAFWEEGENGKYYLALCWGEKNNYAVFESMFTGEFGQKLPYEHALAYINEHGTCICEKNAVKTLAKML